MCRFYSFLLFHCRIVELPNCRIVFFIIFNNLIHCFIAPFANSHKAKYHQHEAHNHYCYNYFSNHATPPFTLTSLITSPSAGRPLRTFSIFVSVVLMSTKSLLRVLIVSYHCRFVNTIFLSRSAVSIASTLARSSAALASSFCSIVNRSTFCALSNTLFIVVNICKARSAKRKAKSAMRYALCALRLV